MLTSFAETVLEIEPTKLALADVAALVTRTGASQRAGPQQTPDDVGADAVEALYLDEREAAVAVDRLAGDERGSSEANAATPTRSAGVS